MRRERAEVNTPSAAAAKEGVWAISLSCDISDNMESWNGPILLIRDAGRDPVKERRSNCYMSVGTPAHECS